jgi:1,2-dihydroxy-3-keto-5-methylthiopentene dioxygenase
MARLLLPDGSTLTDVAAIERELAPLHVKLKQWPVGDSADLRGLLAKDALDDAGKAGVLTGLDRYFEELKRTQGYQTRDLIVLHPGVPQIDEVLAKFDRIHTHSDDEVRYIVDGEGVFGFVRPDGSQVRLTVEPEEYINVPKGTEHWFYLTEKKRIKAVRYFTDMAGWVPSYTGRPIAPAKA